MALLEVERLTTALSADWLEQHAVLRALVVERESVALMADKGDPAGMRVPLGIAART